MILSKIEQTVKKYHMLSDGDFVAVGVSGGADSMCLLHWLISVRETLHLKLLVLNVEHGIRGSASVEDSAFVRRYCEEHGVDFKGISIDAVAGAKAAGRGVEEYSRQQRYAFFASVGADKIATAHNATDNLETLLFRLARGTGLKGACGIPAVRDNIIRPLIGCSSAEIRSFCREQCVPFVEDETNGDNRYARNLIRHAVLPPLREVNENLEENAARFFRSAAEAEDCLDELALACMSKAYVDDALLIAELKNVHPAVVKRVILKLTASAGFVPDERHLESICRLLTAPGRVQLKGVLYAVSDSVRLRLAVFDENRTPVRFTVEQKTVSAENFSKNCQLLKKEFAFYCDCDKISGSLSVRSRREGDTVRPCGRGVTKTLKKLFNELKIPVENRDAVAVICDSEGVIGVYGCCTDERVKTDSSTQHVLLVKVMTEDKY